MSRADAVALQLDTALRTLFNVGQAHRDYPALVVANADDHALSNEAKRHSAGLMRVNHVGEVCAQALYAGQAAMARSDAVRRFNAQAAQEERDHLLWCAQRLKELNARPSLLNPLWYAGAFALGFAAGAAGDRVSLAFVQETEAQVEAHLKRHASELPAADAASRAIVATMQADEAAHGQQAQEMGAAPMPTLAKTLMRWSAKVMTVTAYRV